MAATVMFDTGKKDYTAEVSSLINQIESTANDTGLLSLLYEFSSLPNCEHNIYRDR